MSSNMPMRIPEGFGEAETLNPDGNPEVDAVAQKVIAQANASGGGELHEAPIPPQTNHDALHVVLPVGLTNPLTGGETRTAEVRELNGEDEEYAARGKHFVDRKSRIIERGTVQLGEEEPKKSVLMALAAGDRETILLGIARATYGDELEMELTCPACKAEQTAVVDLATDIEVRGYDSLRQEHTLKDGTVVRFHWATGDSEKTLWDYATKHPEATTPEMNTQMLGAVLESVGDQEVFGPDEARALGMKHRSEILTYIGENAPGPQYDLLRHTCESCEHEANLEVSFGDLFR